MSINRQDAWSVEEDLTLAEVVLRYVREGKTQLKAFEEVGSKLGRTPAACGFRWNASIRKKYDQAVKMAKQQKKNEKVPKANDRNEEVEDKGAVSSNSQESALTLKDVIIYLQNLEEKGSDMRSLHTKLTEMESENEALTNRLQLVEKELSRVKEDYTSFLSLVDRARSQQIIEKS